MTNTERDELLIDMHAKLAVAVEQIQDQRRTLYGNGKAGLCREFHEVKQKQIDCQGLSKARIAYRANFIAACGVVVAFISLLITARVAGVL